MAKDSPDTILLHGDDSSGRIKDGMAAAAITPGELIERAGVNTTGAADTPTLQPHSSAAVKAGVRVAHEYSKTGKGIADDYAADDHVEYRDYEPGEQFYGFVFAGGNAGGTGADVGANANIALGDRLVSYGDGTLRAFDGGNGDAEGAALVEAVEAVDNSGGTSAARIRLEAI